MDGVIEIPTQPDLPTGPTFRCVECGTRLRRGQPHTALAPRAHQTLSLLITSERHDDGLSEYVAGSHRGITGYRPALKPGARGQQHYDGGRIITGRLVQDPVDLLWREVR